MPRLRHRLEPADDAHSSRPTTLVNTTHLEDANISGHLRGCPPSHARHPGADRHHGHLLTELGARTPLIVVGRPLVVPVGDGLPQRALAARAGRPGRATARSPLCRAAHESQSSTSPSSSTATLREAGAHLKISGPNGGPGRLLLSWGGRDLYAGLAGRLVGVGVRGRCAAVDHPVDESGAATGTPRLALAGVDPPFEVLALAAECWAAAGSNHGSAVGTTLVDEQGDSWREARRSFLVSRTSRTTG